MKRIICALLVCALCACALSGCGKKESADAAQAPQANFDVDTTAVPEEGDHGEEDQSLALEAMPTLEPVVRIDDGSGQSDYYDIAAVLSGQQTGEDAEAIDDGGEPAEDSGDNPQPRVASGGIDPGAYQYSALIDTSLGFTFNYPSHWENVPGVFTVCYREKVEPGDFPARVAISAKKLVHSPEGTVLSDELTSYMRMVYKQYDPDSFQVGEPNAEDTFMGKQAYSNTYLAYSGETEVKGFVIGRAVKRTLYVFHFCASYEDYAAMERVMRYMVNSVELVDDEE